MKYTLRKYSGAGSKLTCPQCGRANCFTPYIDIDTQEVIDETVGICDHRNSCGYHMPPSQFFRLNPLYYNNKLPYSNNKPKEFRSKAFYSFNQPEKDFFTAEKYDTVPYDIMTSHNSPYHFTGHNLRYYLTERKHFDFKDIDKCFSKLGVTGDYKNRTVYYQFYQKHGKAEIRTAKILLYDRMTGHRVKENGASWLHSELIKKEKLSKDFALQQVPFGLKQLFSDSDIIHTKSINCFEAEKTACIMELYYPNEFVNIAVGSCGNMSAKMLKPLKDMGIQSVTAYPDKGIYAYWRHKAAEAEALLGIKINVSNYLEDCYTLPEGSDLADFLLN